jgi:hypothetical protein
VEWLLLSLILSVVLTVILNVGLRAFPNAGNRAARALEERAWDEGRGARDDRRVRVYFPWKAMLVVSILLTVLLNLVLLLT